MQFKEPGHLQSSTNAARQLTVLNGDQACVNLLFRKNYVRIEILTDTFSANNIIIKLDVVSYNLRCLVKVK